MPEEGRHNPFEEEKYSLSNKGPDSSISQADGVPVSSGSVKDEAARRIDFTKSPRTEGWLDGLRRVIFGGEKVTGRSYRPMGRIFGVGLFVGAGCIVSQCTVIVYNASKGLPNYGSRGVSLDSATGGKDNNTWLPREEIPFDSQFSGDTTTPKNVAALIAGDKVGNEYLNNLANRPNAVFTDLDGDGDIDYHKSAEGYIETLLIALDMLHQGRIGELYDTGDRSLAYKLYYKGRKEQYGKDDGEEVSRIKNALDRVPKRIVEEDDRERRFLLLFQWLVQVKGFDQDAARNYVKAVGQYTKTPELNDKFQQMLQESKTSKDESVLRKNPTRAATIYVKGVKPYEPKYLPRRF